jgi:hypothetical protein
VLWVKEVGESVVRGVSYSGRQGRCRELGALYIHM